jgi:hypothetical protein
VTDAYGASFSALVELAEALADPERRKGIAADPERSLPSWDRLPPDVQQLVRESDDRELAAIGRMHSSLLDANSYVRSGPMRLSMF